MNSRNLSKPLILMIVLGAALTAYADEHSAKPFPDATPAEQGVSQEAVDVLDQVVKRFAESREIAGGELHIIKNRKTIFRQAYGWADWEERRLLQPNSVYCVRSMTKPLVGTAIQMLIDEGKLTLDKRVAELLPEFDKAPLSDITIQHLLTHTSGLPLNAIKRPLSEYRSLREVAAEAAKAGLSFKPGERFQYSDAGSDTLGALVYVVSGKQADKFVAERILQPLQMNDTITLLRDSKETLPRIPSAYSGGAKSWQRHWKPSDAPIFPVFLTSQSLYSTTDDYAKFLTLWMDGGAAGDLRLLSEAAVRRATKAGKPIGSQAVKFKGLTATYGQQWVLQHGVPERGERDLPPTVIGHTGSDGTHAWAWPQRDLIVLFFTQSRGTTAGIELANAIDRLLIRNEVDAFRKEMKAKAAFTKSLPRFAGIYWDEDVASAYYVAIAEEDHLVLERPGRFRATTRPTSKPGEFAFGVATVKFEIEGDTAQAKAMLLTTLRRTERQPRHEQDASLPQIDDVLQRVRKAHAIERLSKTGVVMLSGKIKMGILGTEGKIRQWFDRNRSRTEVDFGGSKTIVLTAGDMAAASNANGVVKRMTGAPRTQALISHPSIEFGRWRAGYEKLTVLRKFDRDGATQLLIRGEPSGAPGCSLIVDSKSGRVTGAQRLEYMPGAGYVGQESVYRDFREVEGMTLPFRYEAKYANPLIGRILIQFDTFETAVPDNELFDLPNE